MTGLFSINDWVVQLQYLGCSVLMTGLFSYNIWAVQY